MRSLKWSTSHAVFVTGIDDEHKEILDTVSNLKIALSGRNPELQSAKVAQQLLARLEDHFAHEERLMRAARYGSMRWHKQSHDGARRRVGQFVSRIELGDADAGLELIKYLTLWLRNHARLADRILGAFLRNHQRGLYKMTLRAGTKPMDACAWFDANGNQFDPSASNSGA